MKKPRISLLILLTGVFSAFILGFFAGRNLNRTPVQIRTLPPVTSPADTAETQETVPAIININSASAAQLQTLPGIGEVIAQRIVDYREENGPFQSIGELSNVSGIGEKRLEALWDLVTVGG